MLAVSGAAWAYWKYARSALPRIGATTAVELSSGLAMQARVDTGAKLCSIHCEEIEIPVEDGKPLANVGKTIRFRVRNSDSQSVWIEARLVDHGAIRTSTLTEDRYMVDLPLRVCGVEDTVSVTLKDRKDMRFPFLIGRNFLRGRFVVDVRQDNDAIDVW